MVFTMQSPSSKDPKKLQWPYYTGGHFTNLAGKASNGKYVIYDPYFYRDYVGNIMINPTDPSLLGEGVFQRTFNQIWMVNGWHFAGEGHIVGW